jgi:nicotinate phosphoribosyltransferase
LKWITTETAPLLIDLYELTMAETYFRGELDHPATFELFVRELGPHRNFLVSAGLEDALEFLLEMRFDAEALAFLGELGRFSPEFLEYLGTVRFEGDVWAVPEGTLVFGQEPIIRITAPLIQAQIVETFLLNAVGLQTLIASKAARVHIATGDRKFVDFGARRSHGADAALKGARAAYLAGAAATSLVAAGYHYGVPLTGTMAHSYVLAHDDERAAFEAFARAFPDDAVLLIDTYDTVAGARVVAEVAPRLRADGIEVSGVRLDSGDLATLSSQVRAILDAAGLENVQIVASGGLDENKIAALLAGGAPIDGFGVGSSMMTSSDDPGLDIVYKLVQDQDGALMKTSVGKANYPGIKQVFRSDTGDVVGLADEVQDGRALLEQQVAGGVRIEPPRDIHDVRAGVVASIDRLPATVRRIDGPADPPWRVEISAQLQALTEEVKDGQRPTADGQRPEHG